MNADNLARSTNWTAERSDAGPSASEGERQGRREHKQHTQINADLFEKNAGVIQGRDRISLSICVYPFFHPRSSADKGSYFHG